MGLLKNRLGYKFHHNYNQNKTINQRVQKPIQSKQTKKFPVPSTA